MVMILNVYRHPDIEYDYVGNPHKNHANAGVAAFQELELERRTKLVGRLVVRLKENK